MLFTDRSTRACAFLLLMPCAAAPAAFEDRDSDPAALPEVVSGFEITIFAREPLVRNPCSLAFDARGRMFVGHGPQYRKPMPETPPDSIVILEDRNGDGTAETARTFATGFNCVQGMAWRGNDLWVANAPDLTVVRDTNGDDVADEYVRVFTDLGNIEHGIHGLTWAPDGKLYMSKGNSKGLVIKDWKKDEPDRIAPKPFRELWGVPGPADAPDFPPPKTFTAQTYKNTYHDPDDDWGRMGGVLRCDHTGANLEIVARGFRNIYGIGFDHHFDWLGVDQDQNEGDRIVMPFYGAEFGWSHAWSPHWTGENHLPTVPVSGPVFQGSATGVLFADAPNWPEQFRGVWLINDWLLKKTYLYRPEWQGALIQPKDGKLEDFIVGKNALYRPVDMAFGADGALYITGWSRGYGVERDAAGNMTNEGRVFRIGPKGMQPLLVQDKKLAEMDAAELIAEFDSPLPVRRVNAQEEMIRRRVFPLEQLVIPLLGHKDVRTHMMWMLWGMGRVVDSGTELLAKAVEADEIDSEDVRVQTLRILGSLKPGVFQKPEGDLPGSSLNVRGAINLFLGAEEPRVRFAAVQAIHQARAAAFLPELIQRVAEDKDRVTYYATWRAMRDLGGEATLRPLLADSRAGVRCAALLGLLDLGAINPEALAPLTKDADESVRTVALLGMGKKPAPAPAAAGQTTPDFPLAVNIIAESGRAYSTALLRAGQPSYTDRPFVFNNVPASLDGTQIIRTANEDDSSAGQSFLTFDLVLETTVMVAHDTRLKDRPAWLAGFADTDFTVTTNDTTFHLWSKDFAAGKVTLGGNLAGPAHGGKAHYFVVLQPKHLVPRATPTSAEESLAALAKADVKRGEALFFHQAACATCHRIGTRGITLGPDLTNLGDRMEAKYIVQSMLDPGAVITEGFAAHYVEAGGQNYMGVLLSTGKVLKLGVAGGQTVEIPENTITKHETLPVSPMPPQGVLLGPDDVADVTAWLLSQKAQPVKTAAAAAGTAPLSAGEKPDRLVFMQGADMVGEFVFNDATTRRPFFANLRAPGGIPVTRPWPPVAGKDLMDHADMHPGLWLGFGDIAGEDFWRNKGTIRHDKFIAKPAWENGGLTFATQSTLLKHDGSPIAEMACRFTLTPGRSDLQIVWDTAITPTVDGFYFGDQEEMGLGVRVATALTEKNGGTITSSTGLASAAKTWGQSAAWCDYSGTVNGRLAGVKIIPDPANFRPSWWHNRDYGVFVANPYGRAAMKQGESSRLEVKRGESHRLRFTVVLHSSD